MAAKFEAQPDHDDANAQWSGGAWGLDDEELLKQWIVADPSTWELN